MTTLVHQPSLMARRSSRWCQRICNDLITQDASAHAEQTFAGWRKLDEEKLDVLLTYENDLAFRLGSAACFFDADRERTRRLDRSRRMETGSDQSVIGHRQETCADGLGDFRIDHPQLIVFTGCGRRQSIQLDNAVFLVFIPDDHSGRRLVSRDLRFQSRNFDFCKHIFFLEHRQLLFDSDISLLKCEEFLADLPAFFLQSSSLQAKNDAGDRQTSR